MGGAWLCRHQPHRRTARLAWLGRPDLGPQALVGRVPRLPGLDGRAKMSKSLGNSPDPIDLMEKYGADGLRFGLLRIAPVGADLRFDESAVEEGRNFANKLYNACRFRQMAGTDSCEGIADNT